MVAGPVSRVRAFAAASCALLVAGGVAPMAMQAVTSAVAAAPVPLVSVAASRFARPPTTGQCRRQSGFACYAPRQLRAAYDMRSLYRAGRTGAGRTIAIVEPFGSPTIRTDLAHFDTAFDLPPAALAVLRPVGDIPPFDASNNMRATWAEETTVDVEWAHAMAPRAKLLLVETPANQSSGTAGFGRIVAAENYVVDHDRADVISQSFGTGEGTFGSPTELRRLRSAFQNARRHSVTVLAASGDTGATDRSAGRYALHREVAWPSSDPLVTSVGGTQVHLDATGARTARDAAWNESRVFGAPTATGGGRSAVFARPAYQDQVAGRVGRQRGTPDVSLAAAADGGGLIYYSFIPGEAGFYIADGTSQATPILAGIVAVADQAAGRDLGLLNPALYALGSGSPALPDVRRGDTTVSFRQDGRWHTVRGYAAVSGYDLASGLGTVDGAKLVRALAG